MTVIAKPSLIIHQGENWTFRFLVRSPMRCDPPAVTGLDDARTERLALPVELMAGVVTDVAEVVIWKSIAPCEELKETL